MGTSPQPVEVVASRADGREEGKTRVYRGLTHYVYPR